MLKARNLLMCLMRVSCRNSDLCIGRKYVTFAGATLKSRSTLTPLSCCTSVHKRLSTLSAGEQQIYDAVSEGFPDSSNVKVHDISGGCGAMYEVHIESPEFTGKPLIQQHMMVNKVLKSEIANMHGIRITTKAPTS